MMVIVPFLSNMTTSYDILFSITVASVQFEMDQNFVEEEVKNTTVCAVLTGMIEFEATILLSSIPGTATGNYTINSNYI